MAANVKAIPEGCHTLTPHLIIKGAAEAIAFYQKAFGATEQFRMTMGEGKGIGHAQLIIGDSLLFLADEFPPITKSPATLGGSPVTIHIYVENVDALFNQAVAAGAKATMPPMNMFWGDR